MLTVYPFASGSLYTASFSMASSFAGSANLIKYVDSASNANTILNPRSGSRGTSVCLITYAEFLYLQSNPSATEVCIIPSNS